MYLSVVIASAKVCGICSKSCVVSMMQRGFAEDASAEFAAMQTSVSEAQAAADTAQKEAESMQASKTSVPVCTFFAGHIPAPPCHGFFPLTQATWPLAAAGIWMVLDCRSARFGSLTPATPLTCRPSTFG